VKRETKNSGDLPLTRWSLAVTLWITNHSAIAHALDAAQYRFRKQE